MKDKEFDKMCEKIFSDSIREEEKALVSQNILRAQQLLDKEIAKKNKISIEINQTAFERALKTAEKMCDSSKILDFKIEGKTIAELRGHYIIAVKNLFVELEFPVATTPQPVVGKVISLQAPRFFPIDKKNPVPAAAIAAAVALDLDDILREPDMPSYPIANAVHSTRASRYVANNYELGDDSECQPLLS